MRPIGAQLRDPIVSGGEGIQTVPNSRVGTVHKWVLDPILERTIRFLDLPRALEKWDVLNMFQYFEIPPKEHTPSPFSKLIYDSILIFLKQEFILGSDSEIIFSARL